MNQKISHMTTWSNFVLIAVLSAAWLIQAQDAQCAAQKLIVGLGKSENTGFRTVFPRRGNLPFSFQFCGPSIKIPLPCGV